MSEQQNRIVFGQPYERVTVPEEAMPERSWPPGPQGDDVPRESPFQVFFFQDVLSVVWRHARESPQLECAGGLFGHPFVQPETLETSGVEIAFVIVAVAVPYTTPEQTQGHVRVTAEALAAADASVACDQTGLQPVGWYHTHPGHGIFLSGYDLVITRSIFNAAWQIAVVLDPVRNETGLFRGAEGERLPGYRVLRELPVELALMQLYNQGRELMAAGRWPEALQRFQAVEGLFRENRSRLPFWRDKATYRDIDQLQCQLEDNLRDRGLAPAAPPSSGACERPRGEEEKKGQKEHEVAPRSMMGRIEDRALETAGGVTDLFGKVVRLPVRVFKGAKSAVSHVARGRGGGDG